MGYLERMACVSGPPASDSDLARLTEMVGAELPADFVEFLREVGGGRHENSGIAVATPDGLIGTSMMAFYDVARLIDTSSQAAFGEFIPPTALVISHTASGDSVVLSVEPGPTYGMVFWSDSPFTEMVSTSTMADFDYFFWPIASSFGEFFHERILVGREFDQFREQLRQQPLPPKPQQPKIQPLPPKKPTGLIGKEPAQVYKFAHNQGYTRSVLIEKDLFDLVYRQEPLISPAAVPVQEVEWDKGVDSDEHDLLTAGALSVFRETAHQELGELFSEFGDFFELNSPTGRLWLYRCTDNREWETDSLDRVLEMELTTEPRIFTRGQKNLGLYFTRPVAERLINSDLRIRPIQLYHNGQNDRSVLSEAELLDEIGTRALE